MGRDVRTLAVLVVHPDAPTADRIGDAVREAGHEAIVLPDGERAIDRFIQKPADALVVEMVLPGRDGGTTVESIRWAPGGDEVSVILLGTRGTSPERLDTVGRNVGALAALAGELNLPVILSLLAGVAGPRPELETRVAQEQEIEREPEIDPHMRTTRENAAAAQVETRESPADVVTTAQGQHVTEWDEELYTDVDEELSGHWASGDDPIADREGAEVEEQAIKAENTRDALSGDLAITPFPRLLHLMAERRATGALVLTAERDARRTTTGESPKKVVYFRAGVPVYVRSNLVQECLGQVLARGGHISQRVLDDSVGRMRSGEGRQGAVLVRMGALSPHELREALEDQLRVKLFDLFAWTSGSFRFDDDAQPPPEIVTLEMSLADIVLKGVVHRVPPKRLLELLSPYLESFVVPATHRLEQFRGIDMAPVARRVLMSIDGTQRLRDILSSAGNRPGATAQLLHALTCIDAVQYSPTPVPTPRLIERRRDTPPIADLAALREELTRLGRLLREERYAEALGVEPDDAREAIRRSERLAARFRRVTEPGQAPRELRALAYEVCARLVNAQKVLGRVGGSAGSEVGTAVGKRVGSTDRGSGSGVIAFDDEIPTKDEKKKTGDGEEDADPELRPTLPMSRSEVNRRIDEIAPDRSGSVRLPNARAAHDARASDFDDDHTVEDGAGEPRITRDDDDVPTPSISEPVPVSVEARIDSPSAERRVAPRTTEDSGTLSRDALDARVDRLFRAERYFRRGEKALARRRATDAVEAFEKAVQLCPEEGEFLAHLGYARYQAADGETHAVERATDELERAATLAPKLDITHLLLARVLQDLGMEREARDAYERALAANPDCGEALEGLRDLSAE